ncbi:MAG: hypothetical protein OEZ16_05375 [Chromatiales bacterium]|nr:hypothetical protein [Chromatiales bacterium]
MKVTSQIAIASLLAFGMTSIAVATTEVEINHPLSNPQNLESAASHAIEAQIGDASDLDFYHVDATEGDVLNLKAVGGGNIGFIGIGVFDTNGTLLRSVIGMGSAQIADFTVGTSGSYVIGVTSGMRFFMPGGTVMGFGAGEVGAYTMTVEGASVKNNVMNINMEVKPGSNELAPLNPKAKGVVPVAILGGSAFNVNDIDQATLTFGASGNEQSLQKCQKGSKDVNRDGHGDLLCHFSNPAANFSSGDSEAVLRGTTNGKVQFEAKATLKVLPSRRK